MQEDSELAVPPSDEVRLPPHPADEKGILIGPYGLRAGWSLVIFFAIIFTIALAGGLTYEHFHPHATKAAAAGQKAASSAPAKEMPPTSVLKSHGIPLVVVLLASWIMSKIERRRFKVFGLGGTGRVSDCVKGLITGLLALSLFVGFLWKMHLLVFTGFNVTGNAAIFVGLKWLAAFCLVGFTEEFMFRGYLQYTLGRGLSGILPQDNPHRRTLGFWLAAIALSYLFFAGHGNNPGESPIGLLAVFLAGLMFAYSLWHTGSLWWAIGFHTTWDWAQSFLYGVGDSGTISQGRLFNTHPAGNILYSGGLTGPEGSLYVLPMLALIVVVIRVTLPKRLQPPLVPENWRVPAQAPVLFVPAKTI